MKELVHEYSNRLDMIDISALPVIMKLDAVREVALAKIQHLLANVHIPQKVLR